MSDAVDRVAQLATDDADIFVSGYFSDPLTVLNAVLLDVIVPGYDDAEVDDAEAASAAPADGGDGGEAGVVLASGNMGDGWSPG